MKPGNKNSFNSLEKININNKEYILNILLSILMSVKELYEFFVPGFIVYI